MIKLFLRISALALTMFAVLVASPTTSISSDNPNSNNEENLGIQKTTQSFEAKIKATKDDRAKILAKFLKSRGSPMTKDADKLVQIADKYNLDWKLLPAIAGVESSYGNAVPSGSYNPYGWNNGQAYFKDWEHASETVAAGIRTRYVASGTVTPYIIGPAYAANPAWANHVTNYMYQIDQI